MATYTYHPNPEPARRAHLVKTLLEASSRGDLVLESNRSWVQLRDQRNGVLVQAFDDDDLSSLKSDFETLLQQSPFSLAAKLDDVLDSHPRHLISI